MNKEELEKEANVYANAIERKASKEIVQIAYIDAAEPREKRIEELEKENAELKEQISIKDIQIKELQEQKVYWKESSFDWRHKYFKKGSTKRLVQKDKQLTKAKEIIKKLLLALKNENSDYTFALKNTHHVLAEAEQFLKEVEK